MAAEAFLSSDCVDKTRCLILDIVMPGMTGLDLQREPTPRGQEIPLIFITARKGEALRAPAFKQGAYNFATSSLCYLLCHIFAAK